VAGSRRPLTIILTGAEPGPLTLQALNSVCRVLAIGTPTGPLADQSLHDWLAVLLPLPVLDEVSSLADWRAELDRQLPRNENSTLVNTILSAADRGTETVENVFGALIRADVEPALEEEQE
jgi:hypothetical protein